MSNLYQKLDNFSKKKSEKNKIIVIYGPTASGKTSLSINVAKYLDTQIIGADSRQIYKHLDIGTGKIREDEKKGIIHHMIDIINPDEDYSVGEYKNNVEIILENILKSGKIPIIVGGTGLYIDSLIYDFSIPKVLADKELRKKLEEEAKFYGNEFVYNKLVEIDPDYAKELHPNNLHYVIRAIEVKTLTGKSKKDFRIEKNLKYETLFLNPYLGDRKALYDKINKRVEEMFETGLVDEVKNVLNMGYKKTDVGLKTIGYKEVIDYLDGKITLEQAIDLVQQHNRNYAKKQITWFKKLETMNEIIL